MATLAFGFGALWERSRSRRLFLSAQSAGPAAARGAARMRRRQQRRARQWLSPMSCVWRVSSSSASSRTLTATLTRFMTVVIQTEPCSELYGAVPSLGTFRKGAMARTRRVVRRKNMLIDQRKLDAAKAALGAETETAAVDAALDLVVFRAEVFRGLDALVAAGGLGTRTRRTG